MKNLSEVELQPWLNPDETVEALELMEEVTAAMRNTAQFGSMRMELRKKLETQAGLLEEFTRRARKGVVDRSVILAIDMMAFQKKTSAIREITEALEAHVSAHNRRK